MAEEVKPIYKRFYDDEDDIVDFRIINYILKIKIINKEVYIY